MIMLIILILIVVLFALIGACAVYGETKELVLEWIEKFGETKEPKDILFSVDAGKIYVHTEDDVLKVKLNIDKIDELIKQLKDEKKRMLK